MLKKLELQALQADLASVNSLLGQRAINEDPVGTMQFESRKQQLENKILEMAAQPEGAAAVAVFFGGRPVIGSKGVVADFGAKAIEGFQSLVSTRAAELEGPIGRRGPVPQRDQTKLMITDVVRGSVGFVFEEASDHGELLETTLKQAVDEVCSIIYRIGAPDEDAFQDAVDVVDDRLLNSLRTFFMLLDDKGATMRIVEDAVDFTLNRDHVERARRRTDALELAESEIEVLGTLYVLPDVRKFEIHPRDGSASVRGSVSTALLRELVDERNDLRPNIVGQVHSLKLKVKEARMHGREARRSYTLLSLEN